MWRGEQQAFQAPVDVHASADGQVYMFRRRTNESAASSDDEELSIVETRQSKQDSQRNVQLLEHKVLDGDTLNKLALQYGCKVADIKRVNNLFQEQDLFALKFIKIPVQKHSFMTETLSDRGNTQEEEPHLSPSVVGPHDRAPVEPHLQEASEFLMEVDNDIERLIQTTPDHREDFSGNTGRWTRYGFGRRRAMSHGADWGIQWWNALIAVLLIGIALPLFYFIYFKTRNNREASSTVSQSTISSNTTLTLLVTKQAERLHDPG
ncbi:PREDICTED: lysM and putative peptidoglycan-binding domain-containing protein 4 [Cyprinodon variegatus]|uniref:LysM and putative peptidoglycan-binding domain-containing protein 4 n=1 Tax=Cyprinodon variegatus TaxID=28743 RepID=A0A3Q2C9M7_CYPVA|nr:PREDICTED: lysM and putative peptidoglycan-binding domain-containing protein 4 [Cyprinodon variegatus]XP_015234184.1 PREDICTED: lysM and putative peptidoglycan-binding domain-containing protein 4 [Cyprinodon variegatus]